MCMFLQPSASRDSDVCQDVTRPSDSSLLVSASVQSFPKETKSFGKVMRATRRARGEAGRQNNSSWNITYQPAEGSEHSPQPSHKPAGLASHHLLHLPR
ncbi:Filamin-B [Manis pentadactyla]|nr:Filamin-B [Manis pentadactyla]